MAARCWILGRKSGHNDRTQPKMHRQMAAKKIGKRQWLSNKPQKITLVMNTQRLSRAKGQPRNIENRQQAGLGGFDSANTWCVSEARLVRLNTTCLDRWPRNALHQQCTLDTCAFQHLLLIHVHLAVANLVLANAPVHDWVFVCHSSIAQPISHVHTTNRPCNNETNQITQPRRQSP